MRGAYSVTVNRGHSPQSEGLSVSNHPNQHHSAAPTPIAPGTTRKKVNILAMGASRSDFDSLQMIEQRPDILQDAELWGINYMGAVKRLDRIIHVDPVHNYLGHGPVKDMCDWALRDGIPLYTSWPHPFYPNHVVFPFDKIVQMMGLTYMNGSVAAALALAVAEGFNEIGLFGCDFSYPQAHLSEAGRANVEFIMGMASQRGVKFAVASTSTLLDMYCQQQPYGFFVDPMLPPNNGGKLMNATEIIAHCARMRETSKFDKPLVYGVRPTVPQLVVPVQPVMPEHLIQPTAPNWAESLQPVPVTAPAANTLGDIQVDLQQAAHVVAAPPAKSKGRSIRKSPVRAKAKPNGASYAGSNL